MDTHEQFMKIFYSAHGSALMSYGENLDLRHVGSDLSFAYTSWQSTKKELDACEPGEHAETLKTRLDQLEKDYKQARQKIDDMICAAVSRARAREQENREEPWEKLQKPAGED